MLPPRQPRVFARLGSLAIIHEYLILTAAYLVFWTTVPVSRGFYRMKKLREFVHNKCKTLFRVASPFWTNIEYSHGSNFNFQCRNCCGRVDRPESEYEFFYSVKTLRFSSMSRHDNFPNNKVLRSLHISKQDHSTVLRRIGWVFPRTISDCPVARYLG